MRRIGDIAKTLRRLAFWGGTFLILVFLILQLSPLVSRVTEDECTVIYDAHRLVQGEIPYKDFFSMWPPVGTYALSGGPWGWWGRPETGTRYVQVVMLLSATVLLALCLKREDAPALLEAVVVPIVLFPMSAFMGNHWLSVFLYSGAILVAARLWHHPESRGGWYWLGAFAMTAGCTMQTEGILGAVLILFTVLTTSVNLREALRRGLRTLAGAIAACCLWLGPLFVLGAGRSFIRDVFLWPLKNYRKPGNIVDLSYLADLPGRLQALWAQKPGETTFYRISTASAGTFLYGAMLAGIIAAGIISLAYLGRVVVRRSPINPGLTTASILTLLSLGMYAHVNPTWVHAMYAFTPVYILWCIVGMTGLKGRLRIGWMVFLYVLLAAGVLFNCRAYWGRSHHLWEYTDVDKLDRESPLNQSLRALSFMKKGDTIAVLPAGARIYLYTFPAAIGYSYLFTLDEGQYDRADHQKAADEIAERLPKLILIDRIKEKDFMSIGDPISKVIGSDYTKWTQTPSVSIYKRKDLAETVVSDEGSRKRPLLGPGRDVSGQTRPAHGSVVPTAAEVG